MIVLSAARRSTFIGMLCPPACTETANAVVIPATRMMARASAITDTFLYFMIASILSSIASLLKWLYIEKHWLRLSSMPMSVSA